MNGHGSMREPHAQHEVFAARECLEGYGIEQHVIDRERKIDAITMAPLVYLFGKMGRAAIYPDGTAHQTNEQHSKALELLCYNVGSRRDNIGLQQDVELLKNLDLDRVTSLCMVHDLKELFSGDTPINDKELLKTKEEREAAGLILLRDAYKDNPEMLDLIDEYEACDTLESKFVHAMDKLEPILLAMNTKAATQITNNPQDHFPDLVNGQLRKTLLFEAEKRGSNHEPVAQLAASGFIVIGTKWVKWGGNPYDGKPDEIVGKAMNELGLEVLDLDEIFVRSN